MGLFSNKKKPCPICGSPTPRLFPAVIEDVPICRSCESKRDMPAQMWQEMTVENYRQYMTFHQENQPLRDQFQETYAWKDVIRMDIPQKLFRVKEGDAALAMEASCIQSFRILEGDNVLFESSPEGLKCYETDVPARIQAAAPAIAHFQIQYEQYRQMEQMKNAMRDKKDSSDLPYISEPRFSYSLIQKGLGLELTMEHPYWSGTHRFYGAAPEFDSLYPSVERVMRGFEKEMEGMHELAVNLMGFLGLEATDIRVGVPGGPGSRTMPAAPPADPVAEIQRYKALLDSGAITEEEFTAKKRQLLGI